MAKVPPLDGNQKSVARIALAIAALLVGAACASRMLGEPDLPWHLAFGRQIAATWSIPRIDVLAYTHTSIRYLGVAGDLLLYAVTRAFGLFGLQLANGIVAVAIGAAILANARHRLGALRPLSIGVTAGALVAMSPWLFVRPSTFGFLLVAVMLLLIEQRRWLIAAPALALFWANVHGSVTLGVAFLALDAVLRRTKREAGVAVAAAALSLLNPAGFALYRGGADVGAYDDILSEWHHTSLRFFFVDSPAAGVFLSVALVFVALGGRKIPLFDLLLAVGAVALATRIRFVPIAVAILAPIAAQRADRFVRDTALMQGAFGLVACLVGPSLFLLDDGTAGVGWDPKSFPEPATKFVADVRPAGHMWNYWVFGGYLAWRLYPPTEVMIDGRIGFVHDRDFVYRAVASDTDPAAFRRIEADEDIQWAFCRADERGPWCAPVAAEFTPIFIDHTSAVYVKPGGPNAALAANGYRLLTHLTPPERVFELAMSDARAEDLAHDAALMRAQDPTWARAWFVDACAGLATRDRGRFDVARAKLAVLWPGHPALELLAAAAPGRF